MNKYLFGLIFLALFRMYPQNLTGVKFCLDPGHGFIPGQAANCSDAETKRFESWMNHYVVPELKKYLMRDGATVITTRTDYDSVGACITLTQRKTIANNANVNWFHSVHHNAYNGTSNYSLVLFKQNSTQNCPDGNAAWPGKTDSMAKILASQLYASLATTGSYARGDSCFLGFQLGVLSTLSMPGTLSEGSFWDHQPEINRLRSTAYLKTEAECLYLGILQYFKKPLPATHGSLVGIVTNITTGSPLNKARVVVKSLGKTVFTDSLNNGFYRFDTLAPGSYTLSAYFNNDSTTVQATVTAGRVNKKNIALTVYSIPEVIKLKSVSVSGTNLFVRWFKSSTTVDFYDVYTTNNPNSWPANPSASFAGSDTVGAIGNITPGQVYFVKIKARNTLGSSPDFSKTYCAVKGAQPNPWLVVDGFNRAGGTGSNPTASHTFTAAYTVALAKTGSSVECISNTAITDAAYLKSYKYVLWFLGDESTIDETFSNTEQVYVKEFLMQGGCLLVTGSEVAWDLDSKGTTTDKDFFKNYLKAKYVADNPTPNSAISSGISNTIFAPIAQHPFGQVYPEDYPDVIDSAGGSIPVLQYNATQKAAVQYKGMFTGGSVIGKLIYIAYGLETISDTAVVAKYLRYSDDYFRKIDGITTEKPLQPNNFSASAYPNPFNNRTILRVHIPETGHYTIKMYNSLGALVQTITDASYSSGIYDVPVDASALSSGIYFVQGISAQSTFSIKLNLIK